MTSNDIYDSERFFMRIAPLMTLSPATGAQRPVTEDLLAEVYLAPKVPDPETCRSSWEWCALVRQFRRRTGRDGAGG